MMDLDTRLERAGRLLDGAAANPPVDRRHARYRNRRAVLAGVATLAVIAVASTLVFDDDPRESELATVSDGVRIDESLTFDWTTTAGGLSYAVPLSAGDSGLYVSSDAPGTRIEDHPDGAPGAMYRFADDGTWTPIEIEGDDPDVAAMSQRDSTLYALSTGSAGSEDVGPQASASTDGGHNWTSVPLQEATPPNDDVAWQVTYEFDLASTSDHTVALVSAVVGAPYEDLFPELFEDDNGGYTTETTTEGIVLLRGPDDGEPEVVRTVTWFDLGISGPEDLAAQRWAYMAEGDGWTEIPIPALGEGQPEGGTVELHAVQEQFVLAAVASPGDDDEVTAYRGADGRNWTPMNQPGLGRLLPTHDGLLHVGLTPDETIHVSRDVGTTWDRLDLASLDPAFADLSEEKNRWVLSGPLGVAVIVSEGIIDDSSKMLFSTDLERWSLTDFGDIVPDGTFIGDLLIGTDRIVLLRHVDGRLPGNPLQTTTLVGVPTRS